MAMGTVLFHKEKQWQMKQRDRESINILNKELGIALFEFQKTQNATQ